ncbi:hypothetical protein [Altererythrobacter sp. MF3-039]|uniref:hypothetical protein n=1 Tax=Altererythrobacter sp. MF3-039 TaxID=3252901 RepID=UPI00390C4001
MTSKIHRSALERAAIILAFLWQIGSTALPALGLGEPIGSRSDGSRTLITPSGWAFSIWGLLYLASGVFAVWQALPGQRENPLLAELGWPAAGIFFFNGLWATYTQFADLTFISVIIISLGLGSALLCVRALSGSAAAFGSRERWLAAPVLSALGGWLTAATIVNIAAALKYHGIEAGELAGTISAAIIVVGGVIVSFAVAGSRGNPWYALPFLWALLAIYFAGGQREALVAIAAVLAAMAVIAALVWRLRDPANRRHWFR